MPKLKQYAVKKMRSANEIQAVNKGNKNIVFCLMTINLFTNFKLMTCQSFHKIKRVSEFRIKTLFSSQSY